MIYYSFLTHIGNSCQKYSGKAESVAEITTLARKIAANPEVIKIRILWK